MSTTKFIIVCSVLVALLMGCAYAIQCYECSGQTGDCAASSPVACPEVYPYCKLEYTVLTGTASQSCANANECQGSLHIDSQSQQNTMKEDPDNPNINTCCGYDNCNCIGAQCSAPPRLVVALGLPLLGTLFALLMARY